MEKHFIEVHGSLLEATYDQLYANTLSAFPDTRKRQNDLGSVSITSIKYVPYQANNILEVRSQTKSSNGDKHSQIVRLSDADFGGENTITGSDNRAIHISPIVLADSEVKLKCTCMDFYWRFATWNSANKALYGKPPGPYQKKTNRPPVNPSRSPGLCKHLMTVMDRLEQEDVVT